MGIWNVTVHVEVNRVANDTRSDVQLSRGPGFFGEDEAKDCNVQLPKSWSSPAGDAHRLRQYYANNHVGREKWWRHHLHRTTILLTGEKVFPPQPRAYRSLNNWESILTVSFMEEEDTEAERWFQSKGNFYHLV